jgi:tripartite-type tricarboxylate transporter receptor subunit TctC
MRKHARFAIHAALTCTVGLAAFAALADGYPTRPARVMVGFSAGSGADITARVVGQRMGQILGQQIVVENKTGAGLSLAAEFVVRAPKDGYTLLMATIANPINAAVEGKLVALASTEAKRTAIAPELPTMAEAGLPGFETGLWFGLVAPAGTAKDIIDKVGRAGNEAVKADDVAKARWSSVAQAAGLKK